VTAKNSTRKPSTSTIVAVGLVLGAAAFAWFGMRVPATEAPDAPVVTSAGDARPKPEAAVAGLSTGGLPTRVVVPSAGVDTPVQEVGVTVQDGKATWETAWRAAGHHLDSAMPGQQGNMVLTGHVSVADRENLAVFSGLEQVAEGDVVEVYSGDQAYRYNVTKVLVVPPTMVKLLRSTSGATVTLVTCTKDLKNRLVVVGTLAM
jgi:LPXTG-site transpeptidase (sortase) family protein